MVKDLSPLSFAGTSSFFSLPRELRDKIYDHLWYGVNISFSDLDAKPSTENGATFHLIYGVDDNGTHQYLPDWLITSKQTLAEGVEQLYEHARCTPCFCRGRESYCQRFPSALLQLEKVRYFDASVSDVKQGSEGNFMLWESTVTRQTLAPQVIVPRMSEQLFSYLGSDGFFNYLISRPDHPAKKIKFSLAISSAKSVTRSVAAVDLSFFQTLGPRFDRAVFRISSPSTSDSSPPWDELRTNAIIYTKLQHEAARVAKFLVGGDQGFGWSLRDYIKEMRRPSGKIIDGAFEWHVEVIRRPSQKSGVIEHEGLRYCRKYHRRDGRTKFDYFGPTDVEVQDNSTSWVCDQTGEMMTVVHSLENLG